MKNILDLSVLVREPLTIKGAPDGQTYKIPGNIPTEFVLKLQKIYTDLNSNEKDLSVEEEADVLKSLIVDILNLDITKNVNLEYVNQYFNDIVILGSILDATMKHIQKIEADKNLTSPKSTKVQKKAGLGK